VEVVGAFRELGLAGASLPICHNGGRDVHDHALLLTRPPSLSPSLPQVSHEQTSRSVVTELSMATLSSVLLGFGTLFLTLWAGVFV